MHVGEGKGPAPQPAAVSPPHGAIDERPIARVFRREEADFAAHMHLLRSSLNNVYTPDSSAYLRACLADLQSLQTHAADRRRAQAALAAERRADTKREADEEYARLRGEYDAQAAKARCEAEARDAACITLLGAAASTGEAAHSSTAPPALISPTSVPRRKRTYIRKVPASTLRDLDAFMRLGVDELNEVSDADGESDEPHERPAKRRAIIKEAEAAANGTIHSAQAHAIEVQKRAALRIRTESAARSRAHVHFLQVNGANATTSVFEIKTRLLRGDACIMHAGVYSNAMGLR
jgi:hypothetical protein